MRVAGVDDAGRGSVLGPLVIAGVLLDEKDLSKLVAINVKDSKVLTPRKRKKMAEKIAEIALKYHITSLSPSEIDRVVKSRRKLHKLNRLEARAMAETIAALKPDIAYVDASDVLADRFKRHIAEKLAFNVQIVSQHKADAKYRIVSSASVVAKVERDKAIYELQRRYGNLGSGYPSDRETIRFLREWITEHGSYPDFVRKSWKPAEKIKIEVKSENMRLV